MKWANTIVSVTSKILHDPSSSMAEHQLTQLRAPKSGFAAFYKRKIYQRVLHVAAVQSGKLTSLSMSDDQL